MGLIMEKYINLIKKHGALDAKLIDVATIVAEPWVAYKCQYGCARYGTSWCCPPKSPDYKQTREILSCYKTAIIFHTHITTATREIAAKVEKELFFDGYYKVLSFTSGPCKICNTCNSEKCNFPDKTFPSMEACGIDVFQTVRNNGYKIATLREKGDVPDHFGLFLVE